MHKIDAQLMGKLDNINIEFLNVEDVKEFVLEIKKHYQILPKARSTVASEEREYARLEGMLVQQEDLRDLVSRTRRISAVESPDITEDEDELMYRDRDPTESVVSSQNIRRNESVEAKRYLPQKGDVDLIRDQLTDLQDYYSQIIEEEADRRDAGLEPDESLTAFIDSFDNGHHALATRLQDAETILADYKEALQELEDSAQSQFGEEEGSEDQVLNNIEDTKLAAIATAFLSSQTDSLEVYKLLNTGSGGSPVDKSIYINLWMLNRLRTSPGRTARLVSQHEKCGLHLDPDDFRRQVLAYWLEDETAQAFEFPRFAADSHDLSIATASGNAQNSRVTSENAQEAERHKAFLLGKRETALHAETEL
jgi:hypothetical protein